MRPPASLPALLSALLFGFVAPALCTAAGAAAPGPNVVLIMVDDQGYSDLASFGGAVPTPNIDRLASEGLRLTDFYVAQAVCTASRASLLTGCYANRVGLQGALNHTSRAGLSHDEFTLAKLFKKHGYQTAIHGKWHLGTTLHFHPLRHQFDEFFGIPYSNDNSKYHPSLAAEMPPLPLYHNEQVIELDPDQRLFTRRITEHAVAFIEKNSSQPFFLYVPHIMPHVPIFASAAFEGKSGAGIYGDVTMELDWSVGEILAALKRAGLEESTMVIYFSDNGPFLSYGEHAGRAEPLREGKLTSFDGGVRVPCLVRWPGRIPAGSVTAEPLMSIDLLPTFAALLGEPLPADRVIDGRDIMPVLTSPATAKSPHEALFFWAGSELQAVRSGKWKLHFAHPYITVDGEPGKGGKPSNWENMKPNPITQSGIQGIASRHGYRVEQQELALYDLVNDPAESRNAAADHPGVVDRLSALAQSMREALGDDLTGVTGREIRPVGMTPGGE
jgi:arylsulfatase A-like enzyme